MQPLNKAPQPGYMRDQAQRMQFNQGFEESFSYNIHFDNLQPGATESGTLQIQSDSDFEIHTMAASLLIVNATLAPLLSIAEGEHYCGIVVQIADGATQAPLSNTFVPVTAIFGTGKKPRLLPQPRLLQRNSVLNFTVSNLYTGAAGAMVSIDFTLEGKRIYRSFKP